jgi:hypothetical protein
MGDHAMSIVLVFATMVSLSALGLLVACEDNKTCEDNKK